MYMNAELLLATHSTKTMAPTLSRGLVGYVPSPRRTGSPRSRVRLSELSEPEFEAALVRQPDHLPRYAQKTLLHAQLPSSTEVEHWQQAAAIHPPDPLLRHIDVACSIHVDPLKGALKATHLANKHPKQATTPKLQHINSSAAEVGPVRAKQLAQRAAGISNRPTAVRTEQESVQQYHASELYSVEALHEDFCSDHASSGEHWDAY